MLQIQEFKILLDQYKLFNLEFVNKCRPRFRSPPLLEIEREEFASLKQ